MRALPRNSPSTCRRPARWAVVAGLSLALFASGCGPLSRVSDCRRIASTVNPALDGIEASALGSEAAPVKYGRVSAQYLALERRLAALSPPADPGVAQLVVQYRQALERAGQLTRQLFEGPELGRAARARAAERELARLNERHRAVTRQLELACLGHE